MTRDEMAIALAQGKVVSDDRSEIQYRSTDDGHMTIMYRAMPNGIWISPFHDVFADCADYHLVEDEKPQPKVTEKTVERWVDAWLDVNPHTSACTVNQYLADRINELMEAEHAT